MAVIDKVRQLRPVAVPISGVGRAYVTPECTFMVVVQDVNGEVEGKELGSFISVLEYLRQEFVGGGFRRISILDVSELLPPVNPEPPY